MKTYTDKEQSNMLAEILPLESADMSYRPYREIGGIPDYQATLRPYKWAGWAIPCWSLAALLDVLPTIHKQKPLLDLEDCSILYSGTDIYIEASNPVDACVDMIVELNKRNLI